MILLAAPDKNFYYEEVLNSLAEGGDDWHAAQRFHFAACLAFDGNEKAKQAMYECYDPGPKMGEHIGIDFLKMDGIKGLLFVADKIGALLMAKPEEVDEGYLWSGPGNLWRATDMGCLAGGWGRESL